MARRHEATGDAVLGLVDRIASPAVTPASGTAVAVVLELALALVTKTATRSAATWPGSGGALAQCERLRARILRCGEAVELSYAAAMEALGKPDGEGVLEDRLRAAVDALTDLGAQAETTAQLAAETSCACDPAHRADATVAAIMCDSAVRACGHLVDLNLTTTPDDRASGELRLMIESVRESTARALSE